MVYKPHDDDTIAGIATPPGEGALGVVRLSGKEAVRIADEIFRSKSGQTVGTQKSFTARYGQIVDPKDAARRVIDEVVLTLMLGPKSFTAEDVVEISAHGGTAVLKAIMDLAVRHGARPAQRGEFTKRAFLNGRIDLMQAEAVLDLIQAKTELGRAWATEKLEGAASKHIRALKARLVEALTHLEAAIDFPEDFPDTKSVADLSKTLEDVSVSLKKLAADSDLGLIVQRGLVASIAGRPNVGKSSLMNELTREDRVIVTPHPGTTRDVVEAQIQVRGIPVRLQDTAGIQNTKDPIEKEGIDRSKRAVGGADLILYVLDSSVDLGGEDEQLIRDLKDRKKIFVLNKTDLPARIDRLKLHKLDPQAPMVGISCVDHKGVDELETAIFGLVTRTQLSPLGSPFVSTVRQKECLEKALKSVSDAREACVKDLSPELIAVDMRLAIDGLGALTGEVYTDDILEVLFSRFCIGK